MNPAGQTVATSDAEMLPPEAPARVARWVAALLIALFVASALFVCLVRIPETVRCPFVLEPEQAADPVQSPLLAVVQKVLVREGEEVREGNELFVLRSDEIRGWQTQLQTSESDLRGNEKRIERLDEYFSAQLAIKDEELNQIEREVSFRQKHLATSRDFLERNRKLAGEKLVSEVELLRHELDVAESEKDLNVAQRSVQQVSLQRRQLETERARQRTEETAELEKLKVRIAALKRQLENCTGDVLVVRAAYDATVIALAHGTVGSVVQNGADLCQLAHLEGKPRARLLLADSGLGRLAANQTVRLFFDSFPYQRYGTITAKLAWVSPAAVVSSEAKGFTARANLDRMSFALPGQTLPVRVGMRGEARIIVGKRRLIEYLFEPINQLREQTER